MTAMNVSLNVVAKIGYGCECLLWLHHLPTGAADSISFESARPRNPDKERFRLSNGHEETSDLELARLARGGEESAFAEIVRRYSPRVFRTASRFLRRREQVEEAAQEVFLKAFTQLDAYEGRGSMEGWLTRITTNMCLNLLRSAKRRPELTISDLTEDEATWLDSKLADVATERHNSIERKLVAADLADRVLENLSPDDRLVLTLVDGEETPVKEVAEMTGWSESKVKVQAHRARKRMREAVEKLLAGKGGVPVRDLKAQVEDERRTHH